MVFVKQKEPNQMAMTKLKKSKAVAKKDGERDFNFGVG